MSDCNKNNTTGELATPERNNYFYGKLLDESSLRMEQGYFNNKRWMMNRLGLGSGVVCGLSVAIQGQLLCISPGLALDPQGREIVVPTGFPVDPWKVTDDNGGIAKELSRNQDHEVYICIGYRECSGNYVPVLVTDCDSLNQQAASTISESFCVYVKVGIPPLRPTLPDSALCEALTTPADANAKQQAICEALSSRPCAEGSGDACVVLAAVKLKADGTIDPAIDVCGARPLVYSNPELFEMLMCLAEGGGEGTQGPAGPGGLGIDLAEREDRLCTEAPTVRIEGASPNRTLYLGIPPGCDGAQGPEGAGISQVAVKQLPCKELPTAELGPDPQHPPHQILTLGIPGHCDQSLTKITEISWKHDGEMKAQDFFNDGLKITFSADVTATNSQAIAESVNGWFQVSAEVWGGEVNRGMLMVALANPLALSWWVANGLSLGSPGSLPVIRVHGAIKLAAKEAFFKPQGMPYDFAQLPRFPAYAYSSSFYTTLYWLSTLFTDVQGITKLQIAIRVTLMTDFLIDGNKKAVDGNHIGGRLPTGNGVQGGNFESWFRLTDITEMEFPKSAVMGAAVKQKDRSAKATEAELGMQALAGMLPSLAELDELFKNRGK